MTRVTENSEPAGRDHDRPDPDSAPTPGVKPGRAKRRRTASMKVSRPRREPPPAPPPATEPAPRALLTGPWVDRLREFLDSPAGIALLLVTAVAGLLVGPLGSYSLLALAFIGRRPLRRLVARVPLGPRTTLGILIVLAGLVREALVWAYEYGQAGRTASLWLWHPQLGADLLLNIGVYAAWGIGWGVALVWFRYRLAEVLLMQAVFGLVIEHFGQNLLAGIATLPVGLLLIGYAMVLSASTVGLAWLLAGDKLRELTGPGRFNAYRLATPALATMLATLAIFLFWPRVLQLLDAWPAPGPIRERPFW